MANIRKLLKTLPYPYRVTKSFSHAMKSRHRFLRKSYAMHRMAAAIERAIEARTCKEKERAARWAAAWGLLCGIHTSRVRLRSSEVKPHVDEPVPRPSAQITIPPMPPVGTDASGGMDGGDTGALQPHWLHEPGANSGTEA